MKQSFIKISKITEPPNSNIWVYPRGTRAQIKSRIKELQGLGLQSISFQGELKIGTISVLGKGYVGIVVLGKLGRKKIEKLIKSIGLFRNKAKSVYLLSKQLIEKHNGKVPRSFDNLYALPGVGKKTASVVLNEGFGMPTIAVDTHVFRVSNRTGLAYGKNPDEVQENLYKVVPKKYLKKAGHTLLLHGRYTCKARTPSCMTCTIIKYCNYINKEIR